ncbi:uncharacterized protein [Watersipora subatra]|uniref:uncharacterized protein n=1 Tax=Watersipora subatra TaxID=2589382 RepID=UPI00355B0429
MPFFVAHQCSLEFEQPVVRVYGRQLVCTDRHGRLLQSKVPVIKGVVVPARTEMAIHCHITTQNYCPMKLIEGFPDGPPVASSLNKPGPKGRVITRCMNAMERSLTFRSGATIGTYTGVETPQVEEDDPLLSEAGPTSINGVLAQLELFQAARPNCEGTGQMARLASLLSRYATVFSTGDDDVGRTSGVEHMEGTRLIRQTPHRLGREKEAERQVQDLLKRRLIEPAGGAWSSPVVLVR